MAQEENEEIQAQASDAEIKTTKEIERKNKFTLNYLDSLDNYLILIQSLSSTLRQGWLELASARYSMGGSRVNSVLLDLKPHSAATTVELHHDIVTQESTLKISKESETNTLPRESNGSESKTSLHKTENTLHKDRAKVLSMFGTLVSPKLRDSQLSFETALKTIVDIAKARSSILEAHDALLKDMKITEE